MAIDLRPTKAQFERMSDKRKGKLMEIKPSQTLSPAPKAKKPETRMGRLSHADYTHALPVPRADFNQALFNILLDMRDDLAEIKSGMYFRALDSFELEVQTKTAMRYTAKAMRVCKDIMEQHQIILSKVRRRKK